MQPVRQRDRQSIDSLGQLMLGRDKGDVKQREGEKEGGRIAVCSASLDGRWLLLALRLRGFGRSSSDGSGG